MKRFLGVGLLLLGIVGCEADPSDQVTDVPLPGAVPPASKILVDGSDPEAGGNPHFFFLSPLVQNPIYSGFADDAVDPLVTICKMPNNGGWDEASESCNPGWVLTEFTKTPDQDGNQILVDPGVKYGVVWNTKDYRPTKGTAYRIAVSVPGHTFGYVDVKAYDQKTYNSYQHTDEEGNVAISINGSLNITFRIEVGWEEWLEQDACDAQGNNLQDCDVGFFTVDQGGFLEVVGDPNSSGGTLASRVDIPAGAILPEGETGSSYSVVLELELPDAFQFGDLPTDQQIPPFVDIRTYPEGVTFPTSEQGVSVVLCLLQTYPDDDLLHDEFVIFRVHDPQGPNETTEILPTNEDYSNLCSQVFGARTDSADPAEKSLLDRLAAGFSKATGLFLPQPLHAAWWVHGGLNTVIWDFSEFGVALNVDAPTSTADVPSAGQVGSPTTMLITSRNVQGEPFPLGGYDVQVTVSGANTAAAQVTDNLDGTYTATYTPTNDGTDLIAITLEGDPISGSPFTSVIAPLGASASGTTFSVSVSEAGGTTTVTVAVVNTAGDPYLFGETYPVDVEVQVTGSNTATVQAVDDDGTGTFDGTYVAEYTPTGYGTDFITVTVNGDPTGDSPQEITTLPAAADPSNSSATLASTASVSEAQIGSATIVSVAVLNTQGDAYTYGDLRPISVEIEVSGANTASLTATDPDGDGTYEAEYTPTVVGVDQLIVTIDGIEIAGNPYWSDVTPRPASAANSAFTISESQIGATTTVTVAVADDAGNPYVYGADYPITVTVEVTGANPGTLTATDDDGSGTFDGTFVATYDPTAYGDDVLTAKVNGDPTGDGSKTVFTLPRPVDPSGSSATIQSTAPIPPPDGLVDSATDITVTVVNTAGEPYDYTGILGIDLQITVTGANSASPQITDNGGGTFSASYTPTVAGPDQIAITIDGSPIQGSPYASVVQPRSGDIQAVLSISGGAPAGGIPFYLYDDAGNKVDEAETVEVGGQFVATFPNQLFGTYTLSLPKRDFDVTYDVATVTFDHSSTPTTVDFTGSTEQLPEGVVVWRIGEGGSGNAFQYVTGGRSWTAAQNQIESAEPVLGVMGHMATITSLEENVFVAGLVGAACSRRNCNYQGWIGLTDQEVEGTFEWVTGEAVTFTSWAGGEPSNKNGSEDQVEISSSGLWSTENGASSNNEGHVVEWEENERPVT